MTDCPELETVAAWVLDDLSESESEAFEAHYFACERCSLRARQMQRVAEQLSTHVPMVLTGERRQRLTTNPELVVVEMNPEERATLRLGPGQKRGVWIFHVDVSRAARVDLEINTSDGTQIVALQDVPFDERRGEVALVCESHYGLVFPISKEMHTRLAVVDAEGNQQVRTYILDHEFDSL